jgi:hypothetical protein
MSYNGYTSYESWNVALWIDNTYELQDYFYHLIEEAHEYIGFYQKSNGQLRRGAKGHIVSLMLKKCVAEFDGNYTPDNVEITRERIDEFVSLEFECQYLQETGAK